MACPIGWSPNVLAPVFFGHQDLSTSRGLPTPVRVFYPSIGGAPDGAPFLADCGRYPLVLFLHGQCHSEADHYLRWFDFPAVLARCGYVIAVPDFRGATDPFQDSHLAQAQGVLGWMREEWDHRAQLAEEIAVVGHSFGGILAGRLAATGAASAYVSLSGEWNEVSAGPLNVLAQLGAPALFAWGTESDLDRDPDLDAQLEGALIHLWHQVTPPKHRLRFVDGRHFDYLRPGQSSCASGGACRLVGSVAADVAALFLSRYLPPPDAELPKESVGVALIPPPLSLTPEQESFVGGHLGGLKSLPQHPECTVTLDEELDEEELSVLSVLTIAADCLGKTPPISVRENVLSGEHSLRQRLKDIVREC